MSRETALAYTVHHKGRKYVAGMTAEEIGPDAGDIGAHAWEGGVAPTNVPAPGSPEGGERAHVPPVPTHSALGAVASPVTGGVDEPVESEAAPTGRGRRAGS